MILNAPRILAAVAGLITLLYPLAVYFAVQYLLPWQIALALFGFLLLRLLLTRENKKTGNQLIVILGVGFCLLALWNNDLITLRFYPVLINLALFFIFLSSLYYPPPVIERLARLQHPELPPQGVIYTRKVTKVWMVFFICNASAAFATAIWSSLAWWSLYNGLIAYLLMGLLMGIEYLIRIRTQDHVR